MKSNRYGSTKSKNFNDVFMVGGKFVLSTIQTSVKFRDFGAISSLVSDISLSYSTSLLILRSL